MTTTDLDLMEPDALHRETQRRLQLGGDPSAAPLVLERGYSPLGQLDHLNLRGAGSASGDQQYQYDALGRMSFRTQQQRWVGPSEGLASRIQHCKTTTTII